MIKTRLTKVELKTFANRLPLEGDVEGYFVTREELFSAYVAGMVFQSQGGEFKFDDWLKQQLGKEK